MVNKVLLIIPDNGSFIHVFPLGAAYIASAIYHSGFNIVIYHQDQYHYPDYHLTNYLNEQNFDVVCLGMQGGYYQYKKLLSISKAVHNANKHPIFILGGHMVSPEPEYFLRKTGADYIVIGEGELTIVELLRALHHNKPVSNINGIAFMQDNKCLITSKRNLIDDLDSISYPLYSYFDMNYYSLIRIPRTNITDRVGFVLSGRGCPFSCNFCYRMDAGFRPRSSDSIIEEIKMLKSLYRITFIDFLDELLMSSPIRTTELCEALIRAKLDIRWSCNGRLNFAISDILELMKQAGCVFINYGIESMDDEMLRVMNKKLTTAQITTGVKATLAAGISPGLNIIWGNIGESEKVLWKGVDFLLKYDDCTQLRTIRPVTPYPGSDLYYYAIKQGLIKDCADFYENKLSNSDLLSVNFTNLSNDKFHKTLHKANRCLILSYYDSKLRDSLAETKDLYCNRNINFRGFRQT